MLTQGPVVAMACGGDTDVVAIAEDVISVPDVEVYLQLPAGAIPTQLLSCYATERMSRRPVAPSGRKCDD